MKQIRIAQHNLIDIVLCLLLIILACLGCVVVDL